MKEWLRCPGCGMVWEKGEVVAADGACVEYGNTCDWEDPLESVDDLDVSVMHRAARLARVVGGGKKTADSLRKALEELSSSKSSPVLEKSRR